MVEYVVLVSLTLVFNKPAQRCQGLSRKPVSNNAPFRHSRSMKMAHLPIVILEPLMLR